MNYLDITTCDQLNGDGLRVVLWLSGCSHECRECQNAYSWKPSRGTPFDSAAKEKIFAELEKDWCAGITLSGGDPMFESNRAEVIALCREIKSRFADKTIWMYTGYTIEEIKADDSMADILTTIDVLVDGRFEADKKSPELPWVGSRNQRVIYL